jgi:hypothetical protein
MKKATQLDTKPKAIAGIPIIILSIIAAIPILIYIYLSIKQMVQPQAEEEVGYDLFILFPFLIGGPVILFINGVILLVRTVRKRGLAGLWRTIPGIFAIILLVPGVWLASIYGGFQFSVWNANRVISNQDALNLVEQCKVSGISREVGNLAGDSNTLSGKLYIKKSAQNFFEKQSYFYGYRTFSASYYDTLFKITQSPAIRQKCGDINYSDNTREGLPPTVKWATLDEAKQMLDSCSINEVFPNQKLETPLESQTSNPNSPTGIFMTLRPSSHGYFGRLYLSSADQNTRDAILNFANKKKPVCVYHLPNIIDSAN